MKRKAVSARGRPQKIDLSAMVVFARLLIVTYGTRPKAAARAAIKAFPTFGSPDGQTEPAEYRVKSLEGAVLKRLQRFQAGKKTEIHPDLLLGGLWAEAYPWFSKGERITGAELAQMMAESIAKFLPTK